MAELMGKTVLITGANTGIGRATAVALAKQGASLVLAGRSRQRHAQVLSELAALGEEPLFLSLDLSDLASVRQCAQEFLSTARPLHVLLNNAGLAGARGRTKDGFELTFGVNHLGHFLLTELLLSRLKESAPSRIVNVSSMGHYQAKGIDWPALRASTRSLTGLPEYHVSKLCNVLHARELATRLAGTRVTTYALHPGVIASDVWRNVPWGIRHIMLLFMRSEEEGAATSVHCATSPALVNETGQYYDDCKRKEPSALACSIALADELYARSQEWTAA